jgi:hypothetical protein
MSVKRTRAEINRANAKKSTGPKTVEGKAASSKNAFKHGMYSKSLAPYRDCLGREWKGEANCSGRGSFDRGDLKEVAGAAGRAMEPPAVF